MDSVKYAAILVAHLGDLVATIGRLEESNAGSRGDALSKADWLKREAIRLTAQIAAVLEEITF